MAIAGKIATVQQTVKEALPAAGQPTYAEGIINSELERARGLLSELETGGDEWSAKLLEVSDICMFNAWSLSSAVEPKPDQAPKA